MFAPNKCGWMLLRVLLLNCALAAPLLAQQVPVVEKTLANGMRMLLVERHDDPAVAGGWVAHVGSSNERPGITGIAHLFEHMMFKGTPVIGTTNYARDLEVMAAQEKVRDEMRDEERRMREALRRGELKESVTEVVTNTMISETGSNPGRKTQVVKTISIDPLLAPENWTPRYRALQESFRQLVVEQRSILVKNEFDKIYRSNGGSGMNAFTSDDMTAYFINLPANKLELWMWMESERLLRPVFREFYAERDVVFEERRMRTESTPLGKFAETFNALFWESHPYGWPTVGWPSDIPAISKTQADDFYATYYAPQNITLILVGDLDIPRTTELAEKYFSRIPAGKVTAPDVVTLEVKQPAEKRMLAEAETNPQVDILWHTLPFGHKDSYPLAILGQILSTQTGRLHKGLVLTNEVATQVWARQMSQKWAGSFNAGGEARDGHKPEEVESAIYAEIERLQRDEVPDVELQKVKNNFAAGEYRRLNSNMSILMNLIRNDGNGNWGEINEAGAKLQAVTAADVQRVARQYFTKENRAVGVYTRKAVATKGTDKDKS